MKGTGAVCSFCVLIGFASAPGQPESRPPGSWSVASPDGRVTIGVSLEGGRLAWRASRGGVAAVAESPLGIRRADQSFVDGLRFLSASADDRVDDRYYMPHGKRHDHHAHGRQRALTFANAAGAKLEIIIRADNDGVAFRYRFPESDAAPKTVVEELT